MSVQAKKRWFCECENVAGRNCRNMNNNMNAQFQTCVGHELFLLISCRDLSFFSEEDARTFDGRKKWREGTKINIVRMYVCTVRYVLHSSYSYQNP